jgi:cell division protein FtsQ
MSDMPANVPLARTAARKRWGIVLFLPLSLSLVVLVVLGSQWRDSLRTERVVVEGASILPVKDVLTLASIKPRAKMTAIDLYDVRARLLTQPFVKSATVNRLYPGTVVIQIEERKPIGLLSGGQIRYVDADGMILPYVNSAVTVDIPAISNIDGMQGAEIGKVFAAKEMTEAIGILKTAQAVDSSMYHFISEVDMQNGRDIVLFSSDVVVQIFLGRGEIPKKLVTLHAFWNTIAKTADVDRVKSLDLRYDDQVIVKWNNQPSPGSTGRGAASPKGLI